MRTLCRPSLPVRTGSLCPTRLCVARAGHRLDWDEGLGRGEAFSHEDYTRQLAEEWGS